MRGGMAQYFLTSPLLRSSCMDYTNRLSPIKVLWWVGVSCGLVGCEGKAPQAPLPVLPAGITEVPFDKRPDFALADDVDRNGLVDLLVTNHGGSITQVFFQTARRVFTAGPVSNVGGFHPNEVIRLPVPDRQRYLINAESQGQLIVFEPAADGTFAARSRYPARVPQFTTAFSRPNWGLGLAVSPLSGSTALTLLQQFDPETGTARQEHLVSMPGGRGSGVLGPPVAADLDRDGADDLVIASVQDNAVIRVRFPRSKKSSTPVAERIWQGTGGAPRLIRALDLTGDGALDLLVPNQLPPLQFNLLINDGAGRFKPAEPLPVVTTRSIHNFDAAVDRDGTPTALAAGNYGPLALYRWPARHGLADFAVQTLELPPAVGCSLLMLRDLDGDGWLDAFLGSGNRGAWVLFGPLNERFSDLSGSAEFAQLGQSHASAAK